MRRLTVFNQISVDGFFSDRDGGMRWAHRAHDDEAWGAYVAGNASSGGTLLFGRKTYDLMASFWPTPDAAAMDPVVAAGMNEATKIVFSRSMDHASWQNTAVVQGDLGAWARAAKREPGSDMVVMGSGEIVSQLAAAGVIDAMTIVVVPVVLGAGRTLFETVTSPIDLRLAESRAFRNGNVVLTYTRT